MRRPGPARALRGVAAGALTTFLALLFHVLGGGTAPGPLALSACLFAVVWVSVLIGRARPSLPLLVVAVGASQLVLHTAFAITTGSATIASGGHAGHADGPLVLAGVQGGHAMWPAHVAAGLLTVLAIRRGERVLVRLRELAGVAVRVLARLVAPLVAPALPLARPVDRREAGALAPLAALGVGSVVVRRGPPAFAA